MYIQKTSLCGALAAVLVASCSAGSTDPSPGAAAATGTGGGGVLFGAGGGGGVIGAAGSGATLSVTGAGGAARDAAAPPPPPPITVSTQPIAIDECLPANPAGVDGAAVKALQTGSGSPGGLRWLNPYDGTVFPRGLIAPLLMWDGPPADLVYVHIKSTLFDYKGCFKPSGPNQLQLPQAIWEQAASHTGGRTDPFNVELTASAGGAAMGPITEKVIIAQATLKGSIFYNSYKSKLVTPTDFVGAFTGGQGAILRIVPGKQADVYLGTTACIGCHSVSANGSRVVANTILSGGGTYAVTPGGPPNPPSLVAGAPDTSFSAVYPDGSLYLSNGHPGGMGPRTGAGAGSPNAALYETDTGKPVANTAIPVGAMTPMFSSDGALLAFNDYAINQGHGLALMTFDKATRTANGYKKVFEVTNAATYPGWPFFLPDSKGIVFAIGDAKDFSGMATGIAIGNFPGTPAATSDAFILDVATGGAKLLAKAMGFNSEQDAAAGTTYLPFGPEELHRNFYPTGSPVAAGGYFWIFFDSYRHYGSRSNGLVRQLWGTAVDISPTGTYTTDPSHPAFYLTGQEDVGGNHRAFTALDPCRQNGDSCTTGIDCCGGFCTDGKCGSPPPPPPMMGPTCAHTDESCANGNPCCNPKDHCIAGFCGQILQ
jgi:hypothetical protein